MSSQNGEDGVIQELLDRVGSANRYFVEIGAGDGAQANCLLLADLYGWHGLLIEADPQRYAGLEQKYRHNQRVKTVHARVTAATVDAMLRQAGAPHEVDLLSIDIDGNDYWVWKSIASINPTIVVVEYNGNLDLESKLVIPMDDSHSWDATDYFGASLGAYRALASEKGYRLVHTDRTGTNAFFVREEHASRLPSGPPAVRRANYFCQGLGLPRDPRDRPFLDLETDRLVSGQRT